MNIKIKKLLPEAITPKKSTKGAVGYDCYAPFDFIVKPGRQVMPLHFAIELPEGYEAKIEPRSGFSAKGMEGYVGNYKIEANADVLPGKVDWDYRGGVGVIIKSDEKTAFTIKAGTRLAQMTVYMGESIEFIEADSLSETERGVGGFGHTGSN